MELVIFDCDGVLFESEAANIGFYNAVLERAGQPPLTDTGEAACHALASAQLFEHFFGDRPDVLAHVKEVAGQVDYTPFFGLMKPRDGLHDTLESLAGRYKIAMATNRGATVEGLLDYFDLRRIFHAALGVNAVEKPKPHPDMIVECMQRLGASPAESAYVGDQKTDRQAADAAGVHFVGMGPAVADAPATIARLDDLHDLLPALG